MMVRDAELTAPCRCVYPDACFCAPEQKAKTLLIAHYEGTAWDGDVEAVKRLNPDLWALYMEAANAAG